MIHADKSHDACTSDGGGGQSGMEPPRPSDGGGGYSTDRPSDGGGGRAGMDMNMNYMVNGRQGQEREQDHGQEREQDHGQD